MNLTKGRVYARLAAGRRISFGRYLGRVPQGLVFEGSPYAMDDGGLEGVVSEDKASEWTFIQVSRGEWAPERDAYKTIMHSLGD